MAKLTDGAGHSDSGKLGKAGLCRFANEMNERRQAKGLAERYHIESTAGIWALSLHDTPENQRFWDSPHIEGPGLPDNAIRIGNWKAKSHERNVERQLVIDYMAINRKMQFHEFREALRSGHFERWAAPRRDRMLQEAPDRSAA